MDRSPIHLNEISESAAYQAIETAVMKYFKVKDCIVDLETNSACILFDPTIHKRWIVMYNEKARSYGCKDVPVQVPLERLPKEIIKTSKTILQQSLDQYDALESYLQFRSYQGKIVEGTISEISGSTIKISLKGAAAILYQRDTIRNEQYDLGETSLFLVKRVRLDIDTVKIFLSRRSKKIPEYLLTEKFPKYRFKCYRRLPGIKSWIRTTAPQYRWGRFLSKEIRQTLAWEYLQFYS